MLMIGHSRSPVDAELCRDALTINSCLGSTGCQIRLQELHSFSDGALARSIGRGVSITSFILYRKGYKNAPEAPVRKYSLRVVEGTNSYHGVRALTFP